MDRLVSLKSGRTASGRKCELAAHQVADLRLDGPADHRQLLVTFGETRSRPEAVDLQTRKTVVQR